MQCKAEMRVIGSDRDWRAAVTEVIDDWAAYRYASLREPSCSLDGALIEPLYNLERATREP